MNLYDFYLLTEHQQIEAIYKDGVFVGKRKYGSFTAILFQLDSFYVEIYYKKYRRYIQSIHCFITTDRLEPYLEQVHVEHLVKVEDLK